MTDRPASNRRTLLKRAAALGAGVALKRAVPVGAGLTLAEAFAFRPRRLSAAEPTVIDNPFQVFPDRGWEKTYRDLFAFDGSFTFGCMPNDTHGCILRAHTKNGVIVSIAPTYGFGEAEDLSGNKASHRWDPRCCQKGLALARRFYGDRRVKGTMVRKSWKEWADAGFPRDPETGKALLNTANRGEDTWLKVPYNDAMDLAARAYLNITAAYSGPEGSAKLLKQGYDPDMVTSIEEAGTRVAKMRGGMPLLGLTRVFGFYRFANMLALLDAYNRKAGPDKAKGSRAWDNYAWHTDLPPGHPMVTGQQTIDHDLFAAENANLVVMIGMNWIATKMPDGHWLTEARAKGTRVVCVSTDYQSSANKADEVILVRPGTDPALALGMVRYMFANKLVDEAHLKKFTDLPLLVRMDNHKLLNARDIQPGYTPAKLDNYIQLLAPGEALPLPPAKQALQYVPGALRDEWGDFVVWDAKSQAPRVITRDAVGEKYTALGIDAALTGSFTVRTVDGASVTVRTTYDLLKQYLDDNFDLQTTSEITWAPKEAIVSLAKQIAANRGKTLLAHGMGPNQFFNSDLNGRALLLLGAVTDNIGHIGGNTGSFAGNYRGSVFNGEPQYILENPFDQELDPAKPSRPQGYYKAESAHYYNYGDRPLRVGNKNFTGKTHMPSPTKMMHFGNSNSILGNIKWHHDVVNNTLPKIEAIFCHEWWWTASCEYADIVFGVDSWAELKQPDVAGSCTNPFLYVLPATPMARLHDTRGDVDVLAGIAKRIGELTGDNRFTGSSPWKAR